jgi:hypothetical protein
MGRWIAHNREMALSLRPTGLSSPAYRDWLNYVIVEDGRDVGRIYEDTGKAGPSCGGSGRSRSTSIRSSALPPAGERRAWKRPRANL